MKMCDGNCEDVNCGKCLNTCDVCNKSRCIDCAGYYHCEGEYCNKVHCSDCYNGEEYDVKFCDECGTVRCSSCNLDLIKNNGMKCRDCAPDTVPLMLDEIAKHKEELARLRKENAELVVLRKENEELREKNSSISRYDCLLYGVGLFEL